MSIIVQRTVRVRPEDQPEFERLSARGPWTGLLDAGSRMVAYGRWLFGGGHTNEVTQHASYEDFEHWLATHPGFVGQPGALYEATAAERPEIAQAAAALAALASSSTARIIEVDDDVSDVGAYHRREGMPQAELPPTFGRGSVVSERTYRVTEGRQADFLNLSRDHIWPWLTERGARVIAYGHDPLGESDEVITLFAFRTLPEWHRLSRPTAEEASADVTQAWHDRASLIRRHRGRVLVVDTDFGTRV